MKSGKGDLEGGNVRMKCGKGETASSRVVNLLELTEKML